MKCPNCGAEMEFVRDYGKNHLKRTPTGITMVYDVTGQVYSCPCTEGYIYVQDGKVIK